MIWPSNEKLSRMCFNSHTFIDATFTKTPRIRICATRVCGLVTAKTHTCTVNFFTKLQVDGIELDAKDHDK
ncbi:hypothetical protein HZS_5984 [Henneguya salminicola]|nr:hypothetical protein HZS_5984 [Henneguya salminicola]